MKPLLDKGIVTVIGESGGKFKNAKQYKYSDIPPGPNNHHTEPTPESQAVGATTAGSAVHSNGAIHVSDKMIQGFIDCAYRQGWTVEWKDGNHLKFSNPDGRSVGVNARPPSRKIGLVIKRDLKRSGLSLA